MLSTIVILLTFALPELPAMTDASASPPLYNHIKLDAQQTSERDVLLKALSARLKTAQDTNTAGVLADAIRKLWKASGSPTIDLLMSRASALAKTKDFEVAIDILAAISEIAPDYAQGWYRRADVLLQMGEYGRALHDVGKVLEIEPEHFDALSRLGIILKQLGDEAGALNAFNKALALYPHLPGLRQIVDELNRKINGRAI